jgi:hypothetical protein
MPLFGQRPRPVDVFELDRRTVAELARVLAERLDAVKAFGVCPTCREAEAKAFLARLRRILAEMDGAA